VGDTRVDVNAWGGGADQWWIRERDEWIPLVPDLGPARPLTTFPDVAFTAEQRGGDIVLSGRRADGLAVRKVLRLAPQGRMHEVEISLKNEGPASLDGSFELGWGPGIASGDADPKAQAASQRAIAFDPPRFLKLKPGAHEDSFQWWAVDARYFVAAFLNKGPDSARLRVRKDEKYYTVAEEVRVSLAPGEELRRAWRLYAGPKGYAALAETGAGLERAVDFGFFGSVGKALHRALHFFHGLTDNYGWAIVLLTLVIQALVLPLTVKSFRHGMRMKALQPQIKRVQELFKGDPKRLNAEMMHIYQKNGMKFMGMEGCLPILVQIPIFLALYNTLNNAFELRGAPWMGWIHDLSMHDPLYVLPILWGLAMLLQQKTSMVSADPAQAKMMYIMPVVMTFMFLKLPSGLVLYWLTSSLVSIGVQFILLKAHPQEAKA
jgi:YidC/Oxa1 family membrane protein insertase